MKNHRDRIRRRLPLAELLAATLLAAPLAAQAPDELPFERTENMEPCDDYDPLKQALFGSTHVHTGRSFDASINLVPSTPREAYAFAKGKSDLPGVNRHGVVNPTKYKALKRPLDWGTVTDHSEYFDVVGICQDHETKPAGYYSLDCQLLRGFYYQPTTKEQEGSGLPPGQQRAFAHTSFSLFGALVLAPASRNIPMPICNEADCPAAELAVWEEMQQAAHQAYEPCKFTTFVGYEATSAPNGTTWHRNVIFRNANVIKKPVTAIDMALRENHDPATASPFYPGGQDPEKLWDGLQENCVQMQGVIDPNGPPCEALTIPHNSNLGGGVYTDGKMTTPPAFFESPTREFAAKRQEWEPLVEIYQTKGSSECRWDPRVQAGVDTADEHCAFELLDASAGSAAGGGAPTSLSDYPPRSWVRNVLKYGIRYERDHPGVNPFKLGIVASNDNHNGTMGWHPENAEPTGHAGISDAVPTASPTIQNSYGGHSVVWAEENTRDAIFTALKNKETYGTSGTRIVVRFFGGWSFPEDLHQDNFVQAGYAHGVPMGGDLGTPESAAPHFVVQTRWDEILKTPLQQIQIVKGWVDEQGSATYEKVFTVAGGDREAWVSYGCELMGEGYEELFGHWVDPEFDPKVNAFYYVRVLENPVCRYSTHICQQKYNINPLATDCLNQLTALKQSKDPEGKAAAADAAYCCQNETTNPIVQPVIQERAWTSPIWYTSGS